MRIYGAEFAEQKVKFCVPARGLAMMRRQGVRFRPVPTGEQGMRLMAFVMRYTTGAALSER